jgi:tetratricopeptide (TPR) repeat protein
MRLFGARMLIGFRPTGIARVLAGLVLASVLSGFAGAPVLAQRTAGGGQQAGSVPHETFVTVVVSVREQGGMPLQGSAFVKLSSDFSGVHVTAPTQDGGAATFPNIQTGDYQLEVSSAGYKTASEPATVLPSYSSYNVYVYLSPESAAGSPSAPPGKTTMSPHLQSEIDKGLDKMRHQQFDAARVHFDKAAKMAPGNPDVQYLLGMLEYYQQHYDLARTKLEAAIAIFPSHERALVALGEIQLRSGQAAQAAQTLEKAYLVDGADWHTHYLLAFAYADQREFEKARPHAQRAAELGGKDHGVGARILLGRILSAQNKTVEAKNIFNGVIRDFPNDPAAKDAKVALAALDEPAVVVAPAAMASDPRPLAPRPAENAPQPAPAPPAVIRPWAPPDVDAKEYVVAPDVSCSTEQLVQRTQARTLKQVANFEKFLATEHIEHQDVDAYGNPGAIKAKDFTYLVFIRKTKKDSFFLDEERDGGEKLSEFPTSLASRGLVGLGIFLFVPEYQNDVIYKCEGLGEWRGQAAWEIRFEQRAEIPSRLMTWKNNRGIFPVALKGRVWVAANTYDLLHIETDLREPIPQLELDRDHLIIDYGPVKFDHGKTSLWLPWYAELYMQLHGKRYHHRHTLTNYALFSVDTDHQVNAPKETPKEN